MITAFITRSKLLAPIAALALVAGVAVSHAGPVGAHAAHGPVAAHSADATDDFLCNYMGDDTFCGMSDPGSSYYDPYYYDPCSYDPSSWDCGYYTEDYGW